MKPVYQTDHSGIYVGVSFADEDPLTPGNFLIPAGAYEDAPPPLGVNQAAKRVDDAWLVIPDLRGHIYWLADGSCHVVQAVGVALPEGALDQEPPPAPPTEAQLEATAAAAVKGMLDELARSWQYSSYESARTYKGDVIAKFDAEGTALANYGSTCYAYLEQIKSGAVPRPADTETLLALLPEAPVRPGA